MLSSRLAIWMLKGDVVKVYLEAGPDVRAARIVKREGGDLAEKAAYTAERDRLDRERYLKLYGIDNDDYSFADLIIDTGCLDIDAVAGRIVDFVSK